MKIMYCTYYKPITKPFLSLTTHLNITLMYLNITYIAYLAFNLIGEVVVQLLSIAGQSSSSKALESNKIDDT